MSHPLTEENQRMLKVMRTKVIKSVPKKNPKDKDLLLVLIFMATFMIVPFLQHDFHAIVKHHKQSREKEELITIVEPALSKEAGQFKSPVPSKEEIKIIETSPLNLPPTKKAATVLPPPPVYKNRNVTRLTPDFVSRVVPPPFHLYKPTYCKETDEKLENDIANIEVGSLLKLPSNVTYPKVYKRGEIFHIIKTRFMQHQPTLVHLGKARLVLFKTFCLPSMLHQSTQNFFWIIYVDPALDDYLLQEMKKLLDPYPHYYLLPSLMDKRGQGSKDISRHYGPNDFHSGDTAMLFANLKYINWLPVLESRFDADDALNVRFVEEVQKRAHDVFVKDKGGRDFMFWCINEAVEWHWVGPGNRQSLQTYGALLNSRNYYEDKFCHTPGLTVGVARGTYTRTVAKKPHHLLYDALKTEDINCGSKYHGIDCVDFITNFDQCALRSRTPTSASMADVNSLSPKATKLAAENAMERWTHVIKEFALLPEKTRKVNQHFKEHLGLISQDAVLGQCTIGHSCRPEAQQELDDIVKLIKEGGKEVEVAVEGCT